MSTQLQELLYKYVILLVIFHKYYALNGSALINQNTYISTKSDTHVISTTASIFTKTSTQSSFQSYKNSTSEITLQTTTSVIISILSSRKSATHSSFFTTTKSLFSVNTTPNIPSALWSNSTSKSFSTDAMTTFPPTTTPSDFIPSSTQKTMVESVPTTRHSMVEGTSKVTVIFPSTSVSQFYGSSVIFSQNTFTTKQSRKKTKKVSISWDMVLSSTISSKTTYKRSSTMSTTSSVNVYFSSKSPIILFSSIYNSSVNLGKSFSTTVTPQLSHVTSLKVSLGTSERLLSSSSVLASSSLPLSNINSTKTVSHESVTESLIRWYSTKDIKYSTAGMTINPTISLAESISTTTAKTNGLTTSVGSSSISETTTGSTATTTSHARRSSSITEVRSSSPVSFATYSSGLLSSILSKTSLSTRGSSNRSADLSSLSLYVISKSDTMQTSVKRTYILTVQDSGSSILSYSTKVKKYSTVGMTINLTISLAESISTTTAKTNGLTTSVGSSSISETTAGSTATTTSHARISSSITAVRSSSPVSFATHSSGLLSSILSKTSLSTRGSSYRSTYSSNSLYVISSKLNTMQTSVRKTDILTIQSSLKITRLSSTVSRRVLPSNITSFGTLKPTRVSLTKGLSPTAREGSTNQNTPQTSYMKSKLELSTESCIHLSPSFNPPTSIFPSIQPTKHLLTRTQTISQKLEMSTKSNSVDTFTNINIATTFKIDVTPTTSKKGIQSTAFVLPSPNPVFSQYKLQMFLRVPDLTDNINSSEFQYRLKVNLEVLYQMGETSTIRKRRNVNPEVILIFVKRDSTLIENVQVQFYLQRAGTLLRASDVTVVYDNVLTESMDNQFGYVVISRPTPVVVTPVYKTDDGLHTWIIVVAVLVPVIIILLILNILFYCQRKAKEKMKLASQSEVNGNWSHYSENFELYKAKSDTVQGKPYTDAVKSAAVPVDDTSIILPIPSRNKVKKERGVPNEQKKKEQVNSYDYLNQESVSPSTSKEKKKHKQKSQISSPVSFDEENITMTKKIENNFYDQQTSIAGELENITKENQEFQVNPLQSNTSVRLHKDVLSPHSSHSNQMLRSASTLPPLRTTKIRQGTRLTQPFEDDTAVDGSFSSDVMSKLEEYNVFTSSLNDSTEHKMLLNKISSLQLVVDTLKAKQTPKKNAVDDNMEGSRVNTEEGELSRKVDIEKIRNKERVRNREKRRRDHKLKSNFVAPMEQLRYSFVGRTESDTHIYAPDERTNRGKKKQKNRSNKIVPSSTSSTALWATDEETPLHEAVKKNDINKKYNNSNVAGRDYIQPYSVPLGSFPARVPPFHPYSMQYYPSTPMFHSNVPIQYHDAVKPQSAFYSPFLATPRGQLFLPHCDVPSSQPIITELPKPTYKYADIDLPSAPLTLPHGRGIPRGKIRTVVETELQELGKAQENARVKVSKILNKATETAKEGAEEQMSEMSSQAIEPPEEGTEEQMSELLNQANKYTKEGEEGQVWEFSSQANEATKEEAEEQVSEFLNQANEATKEELQKPSTQGKRKEKRLSTAKNPTPTRKNSDIIRNPFLVNLG